jgi:hypothetical protein
MGFGCWQRERKAHRDLMSHCSGARPTSSNFLKENKFTLFRESLTRSASAASAFFCMERCEGQRLLRTQQQQFQTCPDVKQSFFGRHMSKN